MPRHKPTIEADAIYSRREACQALGISLSTLKKLIDLGVLKVSKPPEMRRIFIKGSSILEMLDRTTVDVVEKERFMN
jgi:predicted site-specific integrase-resolvase